MVRGVTDWLDGCEHTPIAGVDGGAWVIDLPDRVVLHTTEGDTIEGAVATYTGSRDAPHFTVDLARRRKAQHLPLSASSTALAHPSGQPETNRVGRCIQIEIIGRAAQPSHTDDELQFLAGLLTGIQAAGVTFAWTAPEFHAYPPSMSLGAEPWRMSIAAWRQFNGICGHQHVPENAHGDPGAIDIQRVIALAADQPQEDDMSKSALVVDSHGWVWTLTPGALHLGRAHVPGPDDLAQILALDKFTGGAYLVTDVIQSWPDARVAAYLDVTPQDVKVAITPEDRAAIAQQVADLAKLTPAEVDELVKAFGSKLTG